MDTSMYLNMVLGCSIVFGSYGGVNCWPLGAAPRACKNNLQPVHDGARTPQTTATNPYSLLVRSTTYDDKGNVVVVLTGRDFSGIMLQARSVSTDLPVGSFSQVPTGTKVMSCNGGQDNTVTHSNPVKKAAGISFTWKPPPGGVGNIYFLMTVAEVKAIWWSDIRSSIIQGPGTPPPNAKNPETNSAPDQIILRLLCSLLFACLILTKLIAP